MLTAVAAATAATTVATVKQFDTNFFAHPLKVRESQVLRIEKRKYKNLLGKKLTHSLLSVKCFLD